MKVKVSSVANVYTGYAFRTAVESVNNGQFKLLQAKDISSSFVDDVTTLSTINLPLGTKVTHLLSGDILIINKGYSVGSFKSAMFNSQTENVIATSTLFIVRINSSKILPEFLCRYLNTAHVQKQIFEYSVGGLVKALSRSTLLEKIEVPCPPLSTQRHLLESIKIIENLKSLLVKKINIINKITDDLLTSVV